jgi:hypothetical protein
MTDTIDDVAAEAAGREPVEPAFDEQSVAEQLVAQAREKGIGLVGPAGISVTTSMIRWAATVATPATGCGPRRC